MQVKPIQITGCTKITIIGWGKYSKRRSGTRMEHCSWHFYSSSLFQTCFTVFVAIYSISKTPKQVFFNPINIFDIFYTLYYCFIIILFSFNVKFINIVVKKEKEIKASLSPIDCKVLRRNRQQFTHVKATTAKDMGLNVPKNAITIHIGIQHHGEMQL